jgi:hypothetical protein
MNYICTHSKKNIMQQPFRVSSVSARYVHISHATEYALSDFVLGWVGAHETFTDVTRSYHIPIFYN